MRPAPASSRIRPSSILGRSCTHCTDVVSHVSRHIFRCNNGFWTRLANIAHTLTTAATSMMNQSRATKLFVLMTALAVGYGKECCLCGECEPVATEHSDKVLIDGSSGAMTTCDDLMLHLLVDSEEGDEQCVGAQHTYRDACCTLEPSRRSLWSSSSWGSSSWGSSNNSWGQPATYNSFSNSVSNGFGSVSWPSPASTPLSFSRPTPSFSYAPPRQTPSASNACGVCPASQMTRSCQGVHLNGMAAQ